MQLAIPQFLFRTADREIAFHKETTWDDVTQDVLRLGDEGHVRLAERYLTKSVRYKVLLLKRKVLASTDTEEKIKLQASYDEMFYY